jgi:endonuclease/exonuclease/phosphatase family metal-dependent hydrolase
MLQEVTEPVLTTISTVLPSHTTVTSSEEGWDTCGCTIYWNDSLYELKGRGFSHLDMVDYPERGVFWVRLGVRANPRLTFLAATVHFPWVGAPTELSTGVNQRIPACAKLCSALRHISAPGEAVLLAGDFNDDFHPLRILSDEMGFQEVFESLDLPPPITHPVRPSDYEEEMRPNRTLDWIMTLLPQNCRTVSAYVKSVRGGWPAASDHMPVIAVIELGLRN